MQIGRDHSILKHFPLGMAAAYAGELVEAWLGEEWFQVSDRLTIRPERKGLNTLSQGECDLASQDIPCIHEALQAVDHLPHIHLIASHRQGQGSMGISEGRAGPRRR